MGWRGAETPGPFDILPYLVRDEQGRRAQFSLPAGTVRQVAIAHPRHPALARLGLRWYDVPCVSGIILTIGGIDYPCAPFNGFYMGTEIASRNLADRQRYDLLRAVARSLGLDPDEASPALWRHGTDRAQPRGAAILSPGGRHDSRPPFRERPVHAVPPARAGAGPTGRR